MKSRHYRLVAAAGLLHLPVFAQQPAADSVNWRLETIDVVGRATRPYAVDSSDIFRVPVPLIEIPQSIQVLPQKLLQEQELNTLSDALRNVSGVVPNAPAETVLVNPIVRGFESEIYINGFVGYGDTAVADPSSLISVERIEVAKGPTSVLYGGGTGAPVGGLINVVTKTPQPEAFYELGIRAGEFNTLAPSIDINQPLSDRIGFRLAAEDFRSEDYIDAVEIDRLTLSPSLSADITDTTRLLLQLNYNKIEQLEYTGLPAAVVDLPGVDAFQFPGAANAPRTEIENRSLQATLSHQFSERLTATLRVHDFDNSFDEFASVFFEAPAFGFELDGTVAPIIRVQLPADVEQQTIDASTTFKWSGGNIEHTVLAGVSYDATDYSAAIGFDFFNPVGFLDFAANANDLDFGAIPALNREIVNEYRTTAVYLQDHITVAERLHILLSARYSEYRLVEKAGGQDTDKTYRETDPRLGLTYELDDHWSVFAGYATGSRLSLFFTGVEAAPPVPETSASAEIGLKFDLPQAGLYGTIAAYELTREDVPTAAPDDLIVLGGEQVQVGEEQSRGFEIDLVWEPGEHFSLLANFARNDAEITRDNQFSVGSKLPRVPEKSARLAARYRFAGGAFDGLGLGMGITYSDRSALSLSNAYYAGSFAVVDAQASYQFGRYRLGLSVVNLFDRDYFTPYLYLNQDVLRPGQPRSAFLSLAATF